MAADNPLKQVMAEGLVNLIVAEVSKGGPMLTFDVVEFERALGAYRGRQAFYLSPRPEVMALVEHAAQKQRKVRVTIEVVDDH